MRCLAIFVILFLFFNLAHAQTPLQWSLIDQIGDDYQIFINVDFLVSSISPNDQITEDSGLVLSENNFLPGQNFSIGCVFGNVFLCIQPNQTYTFLIEDDISNEYTISFRSNSSSEFVPFIIFQSGAIINSVVDGVQNTTQPLAPLLAFIGVPAAFFIGRGIINFIRKSV